MSNAKLIGFLGRVSTLLHNLTSDDKVAQLQRENILDGKPATRERLVALLNDARELGDLYNDLPGGEHYDSVN